MNASSESTSPGFTLIAANDPAIGTAVETALDGPGPVALRHRRSGPDADTDDLWGADGASVLDRLIDENGPLATLVTDSPIPTSAPLLDTPMPTLERLAMSGLVPTLRLVREAGERMVAGGGGQIVFVARATTVGAAAGRVLSSVVDAGLVQLCRGLAGEWASHGVWINVVAVGHLETEPEPGSPRTRKIPIRRLGSPGDAAAAVAHLVRNGSFMTGSTIAVDGGLSAK